MRVHDTSSGRVALWAPRAARSSAGAFSFATPEYPTPAAEAWQTSPQGYPRGACTISTSPESEPSAQAVSVAANSLPAQACGSTVPISASCIHVERYACGRHRPYRSRPPDHVAKLRASSELCPASLPAAMRWLTSSQAALRPWPSSSSCRARRCETVHRSRARSSMLVRLVRSGNPAPFAYSRVLRRSPWRSRVARSRPNLDFRLVVLVVCVQVWLVATSALRLRTPRETSGSVTRDSIVSDAARGVPRVALIPLAIR